MCSSLTLGHPNLAGDSKRGAIQTKFINGVSNAERKFPDRDNAFPIPFMLAI